MILTLLMLGGRRGSSIHGTSLLFFITAAKSKRTAEAEILVLRAGLVSLPVSYGVPFSGTYSILGPMCMSVNLLPRRHSEKAVS